MEALHHGGVVGYLSFGHVRSATVYTEGPNKGKQYVSTVMSLLTLINLGYN